MMEWLTEREPVERGIEGAVGYGRAVALTLLSAHIPVVEVRLSCGPSQTSLPAFSLCVCTFMLTQGFRLFRRLTTWRSHVRPVWKLQ